MTGRPSTDCSKMLVLGRVQVSKQVSRLFLEGFIKWFCSLGNCSASMEKQGFQHLPLRSSRISESNNGITLKSTEQLAQVRSRLKMWAKVKGPQEDSGGFLA